jgi:hypothetical protein
MQELMTRSYLIDRWEEKEEVKEEAAQLASLTTS